MYKYYNWGYQNVRQYMCGLPIIHLSNSLANSGRFQNRGLLFYLGQCMLCTYTFQLHILYVMSKAQGVQYSSKLPRMIENMITVRTYDVSLIIHPSRMISQFLAGGIKGRVISFRTVYLRRE